MQVFSRSSHTFRSLVGSRVTARFCCPYNRGAFVRKSRRSLHRGCHVSLITSRISLITYIIFLIVQSDQM